MRYFLLSALMMLINELVNCRAEMFGSDIKAKCFILDEMNMEMTLVRNLSSRWYHKRPLASFYVRIPQVSVRP